MAQRNTTTAEGFTPTDIRAIAVAADVDPRTVAAHLRGDASVRATTAQKIDAAVACLRGEGGAS